MTLLTIGGDDKLTCRAGDALIASPGGDGHWHGRFSWTFARALLNTPPGASWIAILAEMERLARERGWEQPLLFHGQPTQAFGPPG